MNHVTNRSKVWMIPERTRCLVAILLGGLSAMSCQSPPKEARHQAPARDDLALYRTTRYQPGHELVQTEEFIVPVGAVVVIRGLEFGPGVRTLSQTQELILQQVFNSLEEITENTMGDTNRARVVEFSKLEFEIRAYADGAGSPQDNLALSEARAQAVFGLLTRLGTPPWRLKVKGAGTRTPKAATEPAEDWRRTNRAEFARIR
jgi:outer membrane protein OmpA-like peptidoglycan-associated protein